MKVLLIGNSQMQTYELPRMLALMSEAAPSAQPRLTISAVTVGGATLKTHWEAGEGPGSARARIAAEPWDYVVIQEIFCPKTPEFESYATLFDEFIRKNGAKTLLFATASVTPYYNAACRYPATFEQLNGMQLEFGKKRGVRVAAAGYAWMRYLGPEPSETQLLDLYHADKGHPGYKGTYIYACLLYACLSDHSPVGLISEFTAIRDGVCIATAEALKMQAVAWEQYLTDVASTPHQEQRLAFDRDLALEPVEINFSPGPQYAEKSRKWQGVPGLERAANGRLWATWFSGGCSEDQFNYAVLVTSADDGVSWSEPVLVIDPPEDVRAFDSMLWHDPRGRLWLFWAQCTHSGKTFDGRGGVWFIRCDDSGSSSPTWSAPRRIAHGVMKNRPTVLSTGEWLLPCAVWSHHGPYLHALPEEQFSNVLVSRDQGETFGRLGAADVPNRDCDEHMIVERRDASLWMLVRVKDGIGEAVSVDRGRTWQASPNAVLSGPCSRFHIRRLRSGRLLLINHFNFTGRSHLTAMLSEDDGVTWPHRLLLDERTNVSYPDAVETAEGRLLMIYDRNRLGEGEILLQSFTEEEVLLNRTPGYENRCPRIISHMHRVHLGTAPAPLEDARFIDHLINVTRKGEGTDRVSIQAQGDDGELLILPFSFTGAGLYLDFTTAPGGSIRVELHDFMGCAIPGYTLDDCRELKGGRAERRVQWKQGCDLSGLAGQLIRMRFTLCQAELFSFRFKSASAPETGLSPRLASP